MKRLAILLCLAVFVGACGKKTVYDPPEKGPQLPVPAFHIRITLSDAAVKTLSDAHEAIEGWVGFDGDGRSRSGEYTAPMRPVILGSYEFEIDKPGVITVDHASISQEAFSRLTEPDYYYTVNVYSGRRAFKDNVLGCGGAAGHISEAVKKPIEITCDLLPSRGGLTNRSSQPLAGVRPHFSL